ncbi:hypothetical protein BAMY_10100 [Bacillus amyloliquefaciens]|nr:hypothetical protein BAMY_10100 [Bacillus amyloliquefaciens]APH49794.1 hypothetical protein BSF20_15875 [Bacillus amyloliquefaciens]
MVLSINKELKTVGEISKELNISDWGILNLFKAKKVASFLTLNCQRGGEQKTKKLAGNIIIRLPTSVKFLRIKELGTWR